MNDTTPQITRDYLVQLEASMSGVRPDVRAEMVAGIREELDGLDAAAAAARIADLGDPTFIAAEAAAATESDPRPSESLTAAPPQPQPAPSRALPVTAALLILVGTFVVPIIGPLVGLVLMSFSVAWSRREKIVAWLAPLAVTLILATANAIVIAMQSSPASEARNAVTPGLGLGGWHLIILIPYLVLPIVGVVLFVRASRRNWQA